MQKAKILSVDDDENFQIVMEQYLEADGYDVLKANSVETAIDLTKSQAPDIILLDLGLPDGEGLTLITQFRIKNNIPIIVVSGKADTTEKIVCLEMGADDYLTKPVEMRELSARIKAALRRIVPDTTVLQTQNNSSDKIQLDHWVLDRSQYQVVTDEGQSLDLTTGEFKLLEALVLSPNRALSREQLFDLTRDGEYDVYDRAIDIQIGRIRKKLGDEKGEMIKTVRGIGYMYVGRVDNIAA